jgi:hypothetical protein
MPQSGQLNPESELVGNPESGESSELIWARSGEIWGSDPASGKSIDFPDSGSFSDSPGFQISDLPDFPDLPT